MTVAAWQSARRRLTSPALVIPPEMSRAPDWFREGVRPTHGPTFFDLPSGLSLIHIYLAALIDGDADFLLTYAHSRVPFHLDHGHFDHVTVGLDRLVPVVAPEVHLPGRGLLAGHGILDLSLIHI